MPKVANAQTGFSTGEVSPLFYGLSDNPRYKKGLERAINYILTLQGPMIRRPGTKFCAAVKDAANPPILVPFKFSSTQNYILEVGAAYIRFFANNGQVINPSASYQISGATLGANAQPLTSGQWSFYAVRGTNALQASESQNSVTITSVAAGAVLQLGSPYAAADLPQLRWTQNGDTLYFSHPNYPVYKLQRQSQIAWKLTPVYFLDGPYLPANSYRSIGDSIFAQFQSLASGTPVQDVEAVALSTVAGMSKDNSTGQIIVTTSGAHGLNSGQRICLFGVNGTTEANNQSQYFPARSPAAGSSAPVSWTVDVLSTTTVMLRGSTYTNAWTSGGTMYPAVFADGVQSSYTAGPDIGRSFAAVIDGKRNWGTITRVYDAATIQVSFGGSSATSPAYPGSTNASTLWYLGKWGGWGGNGGYNAVSGGAVTPYPATFAGQGYPAVSTFHQNRLVFAGGLSTPQDVDGSATGAFESFAPSVATTLQVQDNSAYSFTLASEDQNPVRWLASTAQGLLAATYASEWAMTPSANSEALTPTNFSAQQTSYYGAAQLPAVKIGNAVVYVQRASRKVREMAYFFSAGSFRSNDLTEISEHITLPGIAQLEVQKETQPLIWGRRTDGALTTLVYNRDDLSLSAGWSRHYLGGASDAGGTPPVVLAMSCIPDPAVTFDQLWVVVQRWVNGQKVVYVEYLTKISDSSILPEDSVQADCSATYDVPLAISGISAAGVVTTAAAHGLVTGAQVRLSNVLGMNVSATDYNGNTTITNQVNGKAFYVTVFSTTTFQLADVNGNPVSFPAASAYVSGGFARKMVMQISGATWLAGETVGVLADGGIHPDVVVSPAGVIQLQFPAAKVQFGYRYISQGKVLRAEAGSAVGTSIGQTRRTVRAAIQMSRVGDLAIGTSFDNLIPVELSQADLHRFDTAQSLYSGIVREGVESAYDLDSQLCFQQQSMLPGTIQSITTFLEEFDA